MTNPEEHIESEPPTSEVEMGPGREATVIPGGQEELEAARRDPEIKEFLAESRMRGQQLEEQARIHLKPDDGS
jgi:hypothetical protein